MQLRKILVPMDFSGHARAALDAGLELAKAFSSSVHLVHAYYLDIPPSYIAGDATGFINTADILDPLRDSAEAEMDKLIKEIGKGGVEVEGRVLMGHPSQVILSEAERLPADAIVMGTRGLTGIKHVILGSTAERVVRMAHCPVMTLKGHGA